MQTNINALLTIIATMTSNVTEQDRVKYLVEWLEQYRRENKISSAELHIDLLNVIYNLVDQNVKYAIAMPRFASEAMTINKRTIAAMNKIEYKINSKKNTLRSLDKEYMKQYGK